MQILNIKNLSKLEVIQLSIKILKAGGVVIYPTETCYGIGADATNPTAINKIIQFKGKRIKPISIAVADQQMAAQYVEINEIAQNLYQQFLPGPITVVSRSLNQTVSDLEAGTHTLGIRIPGYPFILELIKGLGKPITSTSANQTGKKTPYSLADIQKYTSAKVLKLVDLFLDAGRLPERLPSTVVDTTLNEPQVLRQGEISLHGKASQTFISHSETETKKIAKQLLIKYSKNNSSLIFALQGELGAGKTRFVKGLAQGLEIKDNIASPTYTIIHEHQYEKGKLFHLDTWRLEKGEELLDLGLEKMLQPGNIIAIEWLQKIKPVLDQLAHRKLVKIIWVTIDILSETKRRIKYSE